MILALSLPTLNCVQIEQASIKLLSRCLSVRACVWVGSDGGVTRNVKPWRAFQDFEMEFKWDWIGQNKVGARNAIERSIHTHWRKWTLLRFSFVDVLFSGPHFAPFAKDELHFPHLRLRTAPVSQPRRTINGMTDETIAERVDICRMPTHFQMDEVVRWPLNAS